MALFEWPDPHSAAGRDRNKVDKMKQTPEFSTLNGAEMLAETIRRHWRERGYEVRVEVISCGDRKHLTSFGVITDMVNGWPRKKLDKNAN